MKNNDKLVELTLNSRLRNTHENAVTKELILVIQNYREIQTTYRDQQILHFTRQYRIVYPSATQEEIENVLDNGSSTNLFANTILQLESKKTLDAVQARHQDIKKLERSVLCLIQLLDEIQINLDNQDMTIIEIDTQIDQSTNNLALGSTEITQAIISRIASRKMAWGICFGIFIILGIAATLIYFYVVKPAQK